MTVYGWRSELVGLGDLGVGTHMVRPIQESCEEIDMMTMPSDGNPGMNCLSGMFHIYRVLAMLPTRSGKDVDQGLRWLSDSWHRLPYEMLVEKYADPREAKTYLELRYGNVLNTNCSEPPKMLSWMADQKEKDVNRIYRKRWFEYCEYGPEIRKATE